ncbi:hypothetical protein LUX33_20950 [Actinomadura madurae]|uniref:hypothetical protein n=1 Tax=Actinomadura madurae TaxID=1993 RepID=UPI0020D2000C|nr:hypothetical protein [Actinomadura madurae]MCP9950627.1 hypothetical protein [Actinomadura madurae]
MTGTGRPRRPLRGPTGTSAPCARSMAHSRRRSHDGTIPDTAVQGSARPATRSVAGSTTLTTRPPATYRRARHPARVRRDHPGPGGGVDAPAGRCDGHLAAGRGGRHRPVRRRPVGQRPRVGCGPAEPDRRIVRAALPGPVERDGRLASGERAAGQREGRGERERGGP